MILAETIYVFKGIILRLERSRVSIRQAIVQIWQSLTNDRVMVSHTLSQCIMTCKEFQSILFTLRSHWGEESVQNVQSRGCQNCDRNNNKSCVLFGYSGPFNFQTLVSNSHHQSREYYSWSACVVAKLLPPPVTDNSWKNDLYTSYYLMG